MSSPIPDHHHLHRQSQLGRADSSATGSSAYTQTTRSSSAAHSNTLNTPSTPATTAESAAPSPRIFSDASQSGFKPTPAQPAQPPDAPADDPHSPWKLEFRGVVRLVKWVSSKGNGNAPSSTSSSSNGKQRSRPLRRPKKPLAPIQPTPAAPDASPPLASPVNHRRTTFEIVSPILPPAHVGPGVGAVAETAGAGAPPSASGRPAPNNTQANNVTASASMTLPQLKFTRGLSLIEALDGSGPALAASTALPHQPSISAPSTLSHSGKTPDNGSSSGSSTAQGTFRNYSTANQNQNQIALPSPPSRTSTPGAEARSTAPSASRIVKLDEKTTTVFAPTGGVVVLNSDVSRSGSPNDGSRSGVNGNTSVKNAAQISSARNTSTTPTLAVPSASTSTLTASSFPSAAPRPKRSTPTLSSHSHSRPKSTSPPIPTPTPISLADDDDDVFFTASSAASARPLSSAATTIQRYRTPDEIGFLEPPLAYNEDDDDEYEYDSPKAWRRMSGVDRVHARRERRRLLGVEGGGFRDSALMLSEEVVVGRDDDDDVVGARAAAKTSRVASLVVQFEAEAAKNSNSAADIGQSLPPSHHQQLQPTTRQRPRPPRPLPPIPIVGLPHIRLDQHSDEEEEEEDVKSPGLPLLNPIKTDATQNQTQNQRNVVSLASPSSNVFPPSGSAPAPRAEKQRSPVSADSEARFSVLSAEWVKVDSDFPQSGVGEDVQERGSRRMFGLGRKSVSEVGHGSSTNNTSNNNRFFFPFFASPASVEEDGEEDSSSLHTTTVDHRFFAFATAAASDIGHGPSSPPRDPALSRSKSARLPQRVSMIRTSVSESGHVLGRRGSKKGLITGDPLVLKKKQSKGMLFKDRLKSSFGLKKVDAREEVARPQTPVMRLDEESVEGAATPSAKAVRRRSVLVKKRPSVIPEGFEKSNPKTKSSTSLTKERRAGSSETPRPSMDRPENVPLPGSPADQGSPVSRRKSLLGTPVSAPNSLSRRLTGKFSKRRSAGAGGSLGSSTEMGMVAAAMSVSDAGHGGSELGHESRRRGSASGYTASTDGGGSRFMGGFFAGLSMTSIVSTPSSSRVLSTKAGSGKLTKPNPHFAREATTWSPSYGLGKGHHSTSSSTFFRGGAESTLATSSILNATAPQTPDSRYTGLSESPVVSTAPLRAISPSPLAETNNNTTPKRSSSIVFATPKAVKRISEPPRSASVVVDSNTSPGVVDSPSGWVKVKPRRSVSSFLPSPEEIPPVPPLPSTISQQVLVPAPPPLIPGRRPLPPPPPLLLNPDSVYKKAPLVSLAYTGKQGYYAHEEARLQLQREIAEEDVETSTSAHGADTTEGPNPDISVDYPITPRLKESILRAHLYTSPSSPTAKLSHARMGSLYGFPRTESAVDEDLVLFKPTRPHLPHRQSSASAKRWTLAVNHIPDDSEFLKEIDDLRRSRQELASASRRTSFRKTIEGDVAEDEPCSDDEFEGDGSDEEGVWMKARRAMLTVREMMRTETSYRNHLVRLWEADSANPNPSTPPTFLAHIPYLISASTLLSSRLEEDPSAWGVSAAFLGAEDALEKAFVAWCGVVGQVMLELAGNTPPISTSASRTSLYSRKASTGPKDVLDKEKPVPKRADTMASSASGGSATSKPTKKSKSRPGSSAGMHSSITFSTGSKPLSVQDVAIMPSQRVPRYVLLFRDLLEQTPVTSPSRALVERALQGAMRIAKNCDEAQQHAALVAPSP